MTPCACVGPAGACPCITGDWSAYRWTDADIQRFKDAFREIANEEKQIKEEQN